AGGEGKGAFDAQIGQRNTLLFAHLIGRIAEQIELLDSRVDISVRRQMGRVDLVDAGTARFKQVVLEIGAVGEGRVGKADGPVFDWNEFTLRLDGTAPIAAGISKCEGVLVE